MPWIYCVTLVGDPSVIKVGCTKLNVTFCATPHITTAIQTVVTTVTFCATQKAIAEISPYDTSTHIVKVPPKR